MMAQEDNANSSVMAGNLEILLSDILNALLLRSGRKVRLLADPVIAETAKIPVYKKSCGIIRKLP